MADNSVRLIAGGVVGAVGVATAVGAITVVHVCAATVVLDIVTVRARARSSTHAVLLLASGSLAALAPGPAVLFLEFQRRPVPSVPLKSFRIVKIRIEGRVDCVACRCRTLSSSAAGCEGRWHGEISLARGGSIAQISRAQAGAVPVELGA